MMKKSKSELPTTITITSSSSKPKSKNNGGKKSTSEMLSNYKTKQEKGRNTEEEKRLQLRRLLAARSAHLPGYSWCADWIQWMRNNHPLLALCCRYKENPVGTGERLIILLGSISFGLAATNLVYLFYKIYDDANGNIIIISTGDDSVNSPGFTLTYEMFALWTLGSLIHALIDLLVWHITACGCCMPGACCSFCGCLRKLGPYITITLCALFFGVASTAVVMRANYEGSGGEGSFFELTQLQLNFRSYSFLLGYFIELVLVYFVYYPIMATIFFSGCLRPICCCIGGRPKELERQRAEKRKRAEQNREDLFEDDPYLKV